MSEDIFNKPRKPDGADYGGKSYNPILYLTVRLFRFYKLWTGGILTGKIGFNK